MSAVNNDLGFALVDDAQFVEPKYKKLDFALPKVLVGKEKAGLRGELGKKIINMVQADEMAMAGMIASADQVDGLYLGRKSESLLPPWEGAPTYNAKTMGTKLRQLVAFVIGPMVTQNPYFICRAGGPNAKAADNVQTVLQHFLQADMGYIRSMFQTGSLVARRGRCPVKVTYQRSRRPTVQGEVRVIKGRINFDPIDTRFFRIYPNTATRIENARLTGYQYQVRVQEIDEAQRAGRYLSDVKIRMGASTLLTMGDQLGDKQMSGTNTVYRADDPVDMIEAVVKLDLDGDGFEELWRVVIAKNQRSILRIEPFQLDNTWFADFFFEEETGRYRNESSVGTDTIEAHQFVNDMMCLMVWVTMYSAMPPMFGDSWALPDEVIQSRPGELIGIEGGGKVFSNVGQTQLGALPLLLDMAQKIGDMVSRVSQNGAAAALQPGTTATEAGYVAQGQQTGISGFATMFAIGACQLAKLVLELLYRNFDDWYPDFRDMLPDIRREDLNQDWWIELNGQTGIDTPQAVMQQIVLFTQAFAQLAQLNPMVLQRYPDLVPNLIRSMLEATNIPGKEDALPTREEEAAQQQQAMMMQQAASSLQDLMRQQANGTALQIGNDSLPSDEGMGIPAVPLGEGSDNNAQPIGEYADVAG